MSYAYEALVAHEFALVEDLYISSKVGSSKIRTGPYPGEAILHCFGFDADDALADHLALVAFGAGADLLTCLFFGLFAFEKR
ncbi:ATPase [Aureococcus anophagefferens]|nr:ATPase [Aureococcus anophagefferens]